MSVIQANIDGDKQKATIATKDGIKVMDWEDIKLSELVEMRPSASAPRGYRAWQKFHSNNPWVLPLLIKLSLELKRAGATQWSMRGLFHQVRRDLQLKIKGDQSSFKLNNNYSPYYSRLIMRLKPELKDFFVVREMRSKRGAVS